jgi:hypothetical protein
MKSSHKVTEPLAFSSLSSAKSRSAPSSTVRPPPRGRHLLGAASAYLRSSSSARPALPPRSPSVQALRDPARFVRPGPTLSTSRRAKTSVRERVL